MPPSVTAQPGVSLHSWSQPRVGKVEFEPSTKCSARRANELNFPHARGCVSPAQSSFPGHYSPGTALPRNSPPEPQINQHIFSLQLQPRISSPLLPTALLPKPLDVGIPGPLPAPWRALQIPLGMLRSHPTAELLEGLHGAHPQTAPGTSHHHPLFRGEQQKSSRAVQTHLSSLESRPVCSQAPGAVGQQPPAQAATS